MTARCPGHGRHWFSFFGHAGFRSPACVRCGYPNPRPLTENDWDVLLDYRELMKRPFRVAAIEKASTAEQERRAAA